MAILNNKIPMLQKINSILGSVRFWQLVAASIVLYLQTNDWKLAVIALLTASVGVGTIDRASEKMGR